MMNRRKFLKRAGAFLGVATVAPAVALEVTKPTYSFSNVNGAIESLNWRHLTPEDIEADIAELLESTTTYYDAILAELLANWKVQFGTDCIGADLEFLKIIADKIYMHGENALQLLKQHPMSFS